MSTQTTTPAERQRSTSTALLAAAAVGWVLLLGVTLGRLSNNLEATLHRDETIAWTYASLPAGQIPDALVYDVNPPLYFMALHVWLTGGQGEEFMRVLSVLAIVAAAVVAFDAARRVGSRASGWLSSAFVLLTPSTVALASLARPYALAYLIGMVALHAAITLTQRGRWGSLVLLGVAGGLLPLTHYWGGLLLVAIMVGLATAAWLTRRWEILWHSAAATGISLAALLPWAPTLLSQLGNSPLAAHQVPDVELLGVTLTLGVGGRATAWVLGLGALVAVVAGIRRFRRGLTPPPAERDPARILLVATTMAAFAIVAALWAVSQVRPLFTPNYAFIVLAPAALLVGVTMARRWWTVGVVVAALLVAAVPDLTRSVAALDDDRITRGPEKAIADSLALTTRDGDVVVTSPGRVLAIRYYLGPDRDYVTPIGRVYEGRFDYRNRVARLDAVDPAAVAARIADQPAGTRVAFVHDVGDPWDHPYWIALDRAMVGIADELATDPRLTYVATTYLPGPLDGIVIHVYEVGGGTETVPPPA